MSVQVYKNGIVSAGGSGVGENILKYTPKSYTPTSYCGYQLNMSSNLTAGTTYTMQLWDVDVSHSEKTVAQTGIWVYWGGGSCHLFNWAGSNYFTDGHADYLIKTFTVTETNANTSGATNAWFNMYNSVGYVAGTMNMHIGRWKLELGSHPTPWTPAPSDAIYVGAEHGFIETDGSIAKFYGDFAEANEFIEY